MSALRLNNLLCGWCRSEEMMADIPKSPSLNTQLANALAALATAQDNLARLRAAADSARREECTAVFKVNEAQRHFDALVAEVKKSAPHDTDWRRRVGLPVEA